MSANLMKRFLCATLLVGAPFLASAQGSPFAQGWVLDPAASVLNFQSVKNETKVESSRFATLSGAISAEGEAQVRVLLDSVDTTIDLRNVRMRFLFFETFRFPEAIITVKLDAAALEGLRGERRKRMVLPYTLDLHGVTKELSAEVFVTLLSDERVAVSSAAPLAIATADFNLTEGIAKLEDAAKVKILPSAAISFDFVFAAGAPAPALAPVKPGEAALEEKGDFDAEACLGRFEILSRSGNISFSSGSAALDAASQPILEAITDIVTRCPGMRIEVAGHTDADGDDGANQRLSERRAQSVADWLTSNGVAGDRFTAIGFGEARPVASNDTREGKSRNRRIEFSVIQ